MNKYRIAIFLFALLATVAAGLMHAAPEGSFVQGACFFVLPFSVVCMISFSICLFVEWIEGRVIDDHD